MMNKKRSAAKKVILSITAVLLAGVMIFGSYCLTLAFRDNIKDKYTMTETDDGFLFTVLKGAVFGKNFEASETEINTYINKKFCGGTKLLQNVRIYLQKDKPVELYGRIRLLGHDLAVQAVCDLTLDNSEGVVVLSLDEVKIGDLRIHDIVKNSILSGFADKNENVDFKDGRLYIKTRYEYHLGDYTLTLRLDRLSADDGKAVCKTNSLTLEVLRVVTEFIFSDDGKEFFKRIFG